MSLKPPPLTIYLALRHILSAIIITGATRTDWRRPNRFLMTRN